MKLKKTGPWRSVFLLCAERGEKEIHSKRVNILIEYNGIFCELQ